ncbi:hypothetical protein AAFP30_27940 [Gordonia sp. CPCC 205515]|uniref:hypothetical protein n=1 Tax=Gordonia sp. CPCC 205515 TaxID=3140791 RepID=UPI003AF3C28F
MSTTRRRLLSLAAACLTAALVVAGCGQDPDQPEAGTTAPGSHHHGHDAAPATPVPQSWIDDRFTDPVLEPDASRIPFTYVPKNLKGEPLPAHSATDDPVMWQAVGCKALAFSADAGPVGRTDGGWPSGWTRTPKGAALAAWSIALLFEVMPDRAEFIREYLTGDTTGFEQRSEQRDPRAGVRAQQWAEGADCFRAAASRRVDIDTQVTLTEQDRLAAVRSHAPLYSFTWDFPLVWDEEAGDWKTTADGMEQYWRTTDNPDDRPIDPEFQW